MRVEHLRACIQEETRYDALYTTNWQNVFSLVQAYFSDGNLVKECNWQTVVIIPKVVGDFRGIGLVYLLCNMVTGTQLASHDGYRLSQHPPCFPGGPGDGVASLEANLVQQLMAMRGAVLYDIFMGLQKA